MTPQTQSVKDNAMFTIDERLAALRSQLDELWPAVLTAETTGHVRMDAARTALDHTAQALHALERGGRR